MKGTDLPSASTWVIPGDFSQPSSFMGEETQAGFLVVITVQGGRSPAGGGGLPCSPGGVGGGCSVGALASIQQSPEVLSQV